MAHIILSESSNMANSLFGELQAPIASFLERRDEAWMHDESNIAAKIFKQVKSTHHSEAFGSFGAVDTFAPVGENGAYPTGGAAEGYFKTLAAETWKASAERFWDRESCSSVARRVRSPILSEATVSAIFSL